TPLQPISRPVAPWAAPRALTEIAVAISMMGAAIGPGAGPVRAQVFGDRPAPVPPASVPITDAPPGSAISLAPPSGPAAAPSLTQETAREVFDLSAGGLRIEGRVGTSKIPPGQVTFNIYKGSQFEAVERAPVAQNVPASDVAVLPEGTYYIISNYGDGNSVVR